MVYRTPASKKRQQSSVNSRLDFDATQAAANLIASLAGGIASQRTDAAPAAQRRAGGDPVGALLDTRRALRGDTQDHEPRPVRDYAIETPVPEIGLRCDPELSRIAVALHLSALLRLWIILRELARQSNHMAVSRDQIRAALNSYGIPYSERNLIRWLRKGHTVFWNIDAGAHLVYAASPVLVAQRLIKICQDHNLYDLYVTNYPGQRRDMYITVQGGNTRDFERRVYEAWMASRNNPSLSRWTLERLWNRRAVNLRAIEKGSRIEPVANFAFCDLDHAEYVPFDAEGERRKDVHRVKIDGRYCWQWQISNTYFAPTIRQHDKKGVSRRVFYTLKVKYPELQATSASDAGAESLGSLNRTHKMFYNSGEKARSSARSYGEMIRYVLLGREDGNKGLYQVSPDGKDRFDFWPCADSLRWRGVQGHSSAMCDTSLSGQKVHPF